MGTENSKLDVLCEISKAESLQQIADLVCELSGNPVFIADLSHTMLAYTKCVEITHESWQDNVVNAQLDRNTIKQNREVSSVQRVSTQHAAPVMVEDDNVPFPRIIKTLRAEGHTIGVMVLTAYFKSFGPEDISLVEIISSFVVKHMQRERVYISAGGLTVENYLIKLLNGTKYPTSQIKKHLDVLGWKSAPHLYLLTLWPQNEEEPGGGLAEILDILSEHLGCCFLYDSSIVCIYKSKQEIFNWSQQVPKLQELLQEWKLVAGVSRRFLELDKLPEFHYQSVQALRLGKKLERQLTFFVYDGLSMYHLLEQLPDGRPGYFCHQKIRKIDTYDKVNGTELCATLQVYLENRRSLSRAAEILYIHRNTVYYRIDKCKELLKSDLEDSNEVFSIMLSLRIIEFEKKFIG